MNARARSCLVVNGKAVPKITRKKLEAVVLEAPRHRFMPLDGSFGWVILRLICAYPGRFTIAELARWGGWNYHTVYYHVRNFKMFDYVRGDAYWPLTPVNATITDEVIAKMNDASENY